MGFWVDLLGDTKENRELDKWDEERFKEKCELCNQSIDKCDCM